MADNHLSPMVSCNNAIHNLIITEEGILFFLLNMDTKNAIGSDCIPNLFLVRYAEWCNKYLLIISRKSIHAGTIPKKWKISKLIPVHKSALDTKVENYRPISLLCTIQHGFCQGLSTITQLAEISQYFAESINAVGQVVDCLDFAKAFDRVSHNKLILKAPGLFSNGKIVHWLKAYLCDRYQYIQIDSLQFSLVALDSGVPQGSVLGPLLFLIYVNDMALEIPVRLRLFADDCIVFSDVKCVGSNPSAIVQS